MNITLFYRDLDGNASAHSISDIQFSPLAGGLIDVAFTFNSGKCVGAKTDKDLTEDIRGLIVFASLGNPAVIMVDRTIGTVEGISGETLVRKQTYLTAFLRNNAPSP